jgi:hypothetical protein
VKRTTHSGNEVGAAASECGNGVNPPCQALINLPPSEKTEEHCPPQTAPIPSDPGNNKLSPVDLLLRASLAFNTGDARELATCFRQMAEAAVVVPTSLISRLCHPSSSNGSEPYIKWRYRKGRPTVKRPKFPSCPRKFATLFDPPSSALNSIGNAAPHPPAAEAKLRTLVWRTSRKPALR